MYRPRKESNYLVLALMKEEIDETKTSPEVADIVKKTKSLIVDDHKVLDNIKSHFHVSDPFKLDADLSVDVIENVGTLEKLPSMKPKKKDGVLMVMMEGFGLKSKNFIPKGQIAVSLKGTAAADEIKQNIASIGYIMFHVRKDDDIHLFFVNGAMQVMPKDEVGEIYMNMKTAEEYLVVNFNSDFELKSDGLHPSQAAYTGITRYDPQFIKLEELKQDKL